MLVAEMIFFFFYTPNDTFDVNREFDTIVSDIDREINLRINSDQMIPLMFDQQITMERRMRGNISVFLYRVRRFLAFNLSRGEKVLHSYRVVYERRKNNNYWNNVDTLSVEDYLSN